MTKYRTCVYVDGFNFYYAAIVHKIGFRPRYPSLRSLCLNKLNSFPDEHTLEGIHYFTAEVSTTDEDPTKLKRQRNYNRALEDEDVNIVYGKFRRRKEKRSDVNLAIHFLNDAWEDKYDYAVIISNDTDFYGAIVFVAEKFPDKIVDVWTVSKITRELNGMVEKHPNLLHHRITDSDLKISPQIANLD